MKNFSAGLSCKHAYTYFVAAITVATTMTVMTIMILMVFSPQSWGQTEHKLIRRMAVFPIQVAPKLNSLAEEAWWSLREELTKDKRFLLASRNFLQNKDVFRAHGELGPADVIILSRLLDAHALVTTFLKERQLTMNVYEGEYGRLLWSYTLDLNQSEPLKGQLIKATQRLAQAFIANTPYQGFVIIDHLWEGNVTIPLGRKTIVKASVGTHAKVDIGDVVQFIHIRSEKLQMLFEGDLHIEVFAEGRIIDIGRREVIIEILNATDISHIVEGTLVRLPKEAKRLQEHYGLNWKDKNIRLQYFSSEIYSFQKEENEKKPLALSMAFLFNLAAFLLIAL